jgi:hypothetical protein
MFLGIDTFEWQRIAGIIIGLIGLGVAIWLIYESFLTYGNEDSPSAVPDTQKKAVVLKSANERLQFDKEQLWRVDDRPVKKPRVRFDMAEMMQDAPKGAADWAEFSADG